MIPAQLLVIVFFWLHVYLVPTNPKVTQKDGSQKNAALPKKMVCLFQTKEEEVEVEEEEEEKEKKRRRGKKA